jgi:rhodanese-related sulfurtransferase
MGTDTSISRSAAEFEKGMIKDNGQLLDVRTMEEYESGHLQNALLADWTNMDEFIYRTRSLDKARPVYAYCFSGARSLKAAMFLKEEGFIVYNLDGGIAAWKREGKALEGANNSKQMSLKDFQALIPADKTVLVDFGAVWCPPCKKMEPVIASLTKAKGLDFVLVKIDGGDQSSITRLLNIQVFPTFMIYKKGIQIWKKEGIVTEEELMKQLQ